MIKMATKKQQLIKELRAQEMIDRIKETDKEEKYREYDKEYEILKDLERERAN